MAYEYDICDIAGDENVWADLLSRWGSTLLKICAIHLVPYEYSPTLNDDFQWPSMTEILQCQQSEPRPDGLALSPDTQGVCASRTGKSGFRGRQGRCNSGCVSWATLDLQATGVWIQRGLVLRRDSGGTTWLQMWSFSFVAVFIVLVWWVDLQYHDRLVRLCMLNVLTS